MEGQSNSPQQSPGVQLPPLKGCLLDISGMIQMETSDRPDVFALLGVGNVERRDADTGQY